jgi:hypothetical protein
VKKKHKPLLLLSSSPSFFSPPPPSLPFFFSFFQSTAAKPDLVLPAGLFFCEKRGRGRNRRCLPPIELDVPTGKEWKIKQGWANTPVQMEREERQRREEKKARREGKAWRKPRKTNTKIRAQKKPRLMCNVASARDPNLAKRVDAREMREGSIDDAKRESVFFPFTGSALSQDKMNLS